MSVISLTQEKPAVSVQKYSLGSATISYKNTCYDEASQVLFIHVHEDEAASINAAKSFLDSIQKYCLLELQYRKKRLIHFVYKSRSYWVDPNRIHTITGAKANLKLLNGKYPDAVLKQVVAHSAKIKRKFIIDKKLVVALHNNTNASYSALWYIKDGRYAQDAADVFINKNNDPDDFFYTTSRSYFIYLKQKGYNVVLEHPTRVRDNGSLSVYCAYKKIPYLNIEVQDDHYEMQQEMLQVAQELIENFGYE